MAAPETATPAPREEKVNPLVGKELVIDRRWSSWKTLFEETKGPDVLLGLLHLGFNRDVDHSEWIERICFYLDLADGWNNYRCWTSCQERDKIFRQELADKAFEMLVQHVFTPRKGVPSECWAAVVAGNEIVLDRVISFFLPDEKGEIRNLPSWIHQARSEGKVHQNRVTKDFIFHLCQLAWVHREVALDNEIEERLHRRQPLFVEVLWGLRRLDIFMGRADKLSEFIELSEECLAKLKELALGVERYLPIVNYDGLEIKREHRRPETVEEAFYGGSQAAAVYMLQLTYQGEKKRQDRIAEAVKTKAEAQTRLLEVLKRRH